MSRGTYRDLLPFLSSLEDVLRNLRVMIKVRWPHSALMVLYSCSENSDARLLHEVRCWAGMKVGGRVGPLVFNALDACTKKRLAIIFILEIT